MAITSTTAHAQQIITVESDTPDPDNPGRFLNLTHRELEVAIDKALQLAVAGEPVIVDIQGTVAMGRGIYVRPLGNAPLLAPVEIRNGQLIPAFPGNRARFLTIETSSNSAPVILNNVEFFSSREFSNFSPESRRGGAIYSFSGPLEINNSRFVDNLADRAGGAIYTRGRLTITNSEFENNLSENEGGGAIFSEGRFPVQIRNSRFVDNRSNWGGAAIVLSDAFPSAASLGITDSEFVGNESLDRALNSPGGGAIQSQAELTTISGSTFESNRVGFVGGAISISAVRGSATLIVENSLFFDNDAAFSGGAIYSSNATETGTNIQITNSTFLENTAQGTGGAIYLPPDPNVDPFLVGTNPFGQGVPPNLRITASTFWNNRVNGIIGGNAITARFDLPGVVEIAGSIIGRSDSDDIMGRNCVAANNAITAIQGNLATGINLATDDTCGPVEFLGTNAAAALFPNGLRKNGGSVRSLQPAPESIAVDGVVEGTPGCPAQDVRGINRPVFDDCDFGAVETTIEATDPPPPVNPAPLCDFIPASVYVGEDGVIVGGPLDGNVYSGTLRGTAGNDVIVGTAQADVIVALSGDDRICSLAGNDRVIAGSGADSVFAGADNDSVFGGVGVDTIIGGRGDDVLWGGDNVDRLTGGPGADLLYGGNGNDTLFGLNGSDTLFGGPGDDDMYGGNAADTLVGGGGNDRLFGGTDRDLIFGDRGDDLLMGEKGRDTLNGGAGNDTLDGGDNEDVGNGEGGSDDCFNIESAMRCQLQGEL